MSLKIIYTQTIGLALSLAGGGFRGWTLSVNRQIICSIFKFFHPAASGGQCSRDWNILRKEICISFYRRFSYNFLSHITTSPSRYIKSLVLFLLLATTGFGQAPKTMEAANEAYTNKDYDAAIQNYEQLLSEGYSSEVLHYNLGNAYYRTQQLGDAILHYEKALQVAPSDEDILHNLQVANAQQLDEMENISAFFLSQWWKGLRSRLPTGAWTTIGLLLLWGAAVGFIFWLLAKQRTQRKRGFVVGLVLLTLCVLPFLLAFDRNRHDQHSKEAILMAKETQLHFAPDTDSEAVRTIHEGLKMDLEDKISAWYKVRLPNGEVGWVPEEVVEEI